MAQAPCRCEGCERTFTETHTELPASQCPVPCPPVLSALGPVTHTLRWREEHTTPYEVARAFEFGADELRAVREARPRQRLFAG